MFVILFLVKRIAAMAGLLLIVSLLVFSLLALSPGSIVSILLGSRPESRASIAAIRAQYHLNDPFFVQYWHWLLSALRGDLGTSIQSGASVTSTIAPRILVSAELAGLTLLLVLVLGVPAGVIAGLRRGTLLDRSISGSTIVGMSAPAFTLGILLIYVVGVKLDWLPVFGAGTGLFDRLAHLTLPAVALATGLIALVVRQARASVLDVASQDFVTFARARGLRNRRVLAQYILRNSALPIVTTTGLLLIYAISGAVLVETVFSLPGVGQLLVQSIEDKDVPVVQGLALFLALVVVAANLAVDLLSLTIDPRTRQGVRGN
jgi:peptide/nickel transport system permease protein